MADSLYTFIDNMTDGDRLRVQDDLGLGYVRLRAAEAQRRQAKQDIRSFEDVVIELLRNSRDAGAHAIFVATWTEGRARHLTVLDDGKGIPPQMHETVFEPFVTSKLDSFHSDRWGVHGRGMALYSIRENTRKARVVCSDIGLGSVFSVMSNMDSLPEKRDQSSVPTISQGESGEIVLRGPHNITRTVLEFAIDERNVIAVYLGSCAEIVATLHALSSGAASRLDTLFKPTQSEEPYIQRFGFAYDADDLAKLAADCALPLSPRTARRILNGEVAPLKPHLSILGTASNPSMQQAKAGREPHCKEHGSALSTPTVRLAAEDVEKFKYAVAEDFRQLAQAYFLDESPAITAKAQKGELIVRIPLNPTG